MKDPKKPATDTSGSDYEVGYGKPPRRTRFKPGQSGNPRGRPKGTKNLKSDLIEELDEKILIREGEQARRVSKQRAIVKTLVTKTLKGDVRAATLLTTMIMRLTDTGEGAPEVEAPLHDDERAILEGFVERSQRRAKGDSSEASDREDDPEDSE